jgi:hypothetical protein
MVDFADGIGKTVQLLYFPPYHSKYNPVERCWGILERHWNGAKRVDAETMLEWAKSMTWKGIKPIVTLSRKTSFHCPRPPCGKSRPGWSGTLPCPSGTF